MSLPLNESVRRSPILLAVSDENLHVTQACKALKAEAGTWAEPHLGEVGSLSGRLLHRLQEIPQKLHRWVT